MNEFWTAIAKLIETIANLGAGAASNGMGYESHSAGGIGEIILTCYPIR